MLLHQRLVIILTHTCVHGSLYYSSFFREFLPAKDSHPAKDRKLTNCGAVGLAVEKITLKDGSVIYQIDKDSIALVYGGFKK